MDDLLYDNQLLIDCYKEQLFIENQNRLIIENCGLIYPEYVTEGALDRIKNAINTIFSRIKELIMRFIDFITKRRKKKDEIDQVATDENKTDKAVNNIPKGSDVDEFLLDYPMRKIIISDDALNNTKFKKSIVDINEFKILNKGLEEISNVIKDKRKLDLFNAIPYAQGNPNAVRVNDLPNLASTIEILNMISDSAQERRLFISIGVPYNNGIADAIIVEDTDKGIDYIKTKEFEREKKFFNEYTDNINEELKILKNGIKEIDNMKKQINDIFSKYDTIDTAYKLFMNIASLISKLYSTKISYLVMIDNAYQVHKRNIAIAMQVSNQK